MPSIRSNVPASDDKIALAAVREALEAAIILLVPIVPHITEELWQLLGHKDLAANVPWPEFDPAIASEEEMTIVVQINGKLRSRMTVAVDEDPEKIKADALADEKIKSMTAGMQIKKVIYVPKKLVNIVVVLSNDAQGDTRYKHKCTNDIIEGFRVKIISAIYDKIIINLFSLRCYCLAVAIPLPRRERTLITVFKKFMWNHLKIKRHRPEIENYVRTAFIDQFIQNSRFKIVRKR